ncbi:MAG TPA: sterol desaturase family protein [Rhizomicrobium sp.]|nr:sterol desaturase family protein [Rhizomicrobium sp.]
MLRALQAAYGHLARDITNDGLMILAFGLMGIGFYLLFEPGRRLSLRAALTHVFRRDLFGHRTSRVDILHFVLMAGLWIPLTGALVAASLTMNFGCFLAERFGQRHALLGDGCIAATLQFVVIMTCRELGTYVAHYLLHKVPVLWSIHRTHHSAEVLTFFTSARAHPVEYLHMQGFNALFAGAGGGLFLYLTGSVLHTAPVLVLAASVIFFETFALAQHSHLPVSFGKLNYLFTSPVMHQVHHSAERRHRDRNFGTQLAIFDWLFGTLYLPRGREDYRLGLNERELGEDNPHLRLRDFYFEPALHAWRLLTRSVKAGSDTSPEGRLPPRCRR